MRVRNLLIADIGCWYCKGKKLVYFGCYKGKKFADVVRCHEGNKFSDYGCYMGTNLLIVNVIWSEIY